MYAPIIPHLSRLEPVIWAEVAQPFVDPDLIWLYPNRPPHEYRSFPCLLCPADEKFSICSFGGPTRHTTGIERPLWVDRLPSHISKTVVSTVSGGGQSGTRSLSAVSGQ